MRYRKLKADQIFSGYTFLEENQILILDERGFVKEIIEENEAGDDIEYLEGILTPGFINCHCHIELSHLKGIIPPHTGLVNFLLEVVKNRAVDEELIVERIMAAEKELYENGIVSVADVCNTIHAMESKKQSRLKWHNLIEVINLYDSNLEKQWQHYSTVLQEYKGLDDTNPYSMTSVLTPHAPYTVSPATYEAINDATANAIISIHNQETEAENELFKTGKGEFLKLYAHFGSSESPFTISGKTSLQTYLPYFTNGQTLLLVHNTFISEEDILFAAQHAEKYNLKIVYCLCPNANLYIENALPPVDLLLKHHCKIVIGTDSYSSNWQLSIAAEIKALLQHFPHLSLETVLQWATSNGAEVMQDTGFGGFEIGKRPGVILMNGKDFTAKRII